MRILHAHTPSSCVLGTAFGTWIFPFWLWQQEITPLLYIQSSGINGSELNQQHPGDESQTQPQAGLTRLGPQRLLLPTQLCPGQLQGLSLPSPPARAACGMRGALAL